MILSDDFIEIENFLPLEQQEQLIKDLTHPSFPWGLSLNSVYGAAGVIDNDAAVGFYHTFMFEGKSRSPELHLVDWILNGFEEKIYNRIRIKNMDRIRGGVFLKHPSIIPHPPHVDAETPHWTAVYYVTDCDGDFVLYNETYPEFKNEFRKDNSEFTVKRRVKPAQGKLVAFNGKYFHSSSFPNDKAIRLAITFNFHIY